MTVSEQGRPVTVLPFLRALDPAQNQIRASWRFLKEACFLERKMDMPQLHVYCQRGHECTNSNGFDDPIQQYWQCQNKSCRVVLCRSCWEHYTRSLHQNDSTFRKLLTLAVWDCPCCDFKNQHQIYPGDFKGS